MATPREIEELLAELREDNATGVAFREPAVDLSDAISGGRTWHVDAVSNGRLIRAWYVESDKEGGQDRYVLEAFPIRDLVKVEIEHGWGNVTWNDPVEGTVEMPIAWETARALLRTPHA